MALTYANVRGLLLSMDTSGQLGIEIHTVKREIGRLGILPYSEFWARTSHRRTPAPALPPTLDLHRSVIQFQVYRP